MNLYLSLKDIYQGKTLPVEVVNMQLCPHCGGSGADREEDVVTCNVCGGKGFVMRTQQIGPGFVQQFQQQCQACGGKGKTLKSTCHVCKGEKVVRNKKIIRVYIARGVADGEELAYDGEGDESPDYEAGSIIFKVVTAKHALFERKGNDLHTSMKISLLEALVGFKKSLQHLDAHLVEVAREEVTPHGFVLRIKNEGMPIPGTASAGELVITFQVQLPSSLTQAQKDAFAKLL